MKVSDVVKKYLDELDLTQEEFASALNMSLRNTNVSRASVSYWLNGKYEPETDFLLICMVAYQDWRMQFAVDCLCAKLPEVYERDEAGKLRMLTT